MREYKVAAEDSKHFSLKTDNREIGRLTYKKWYSYKAEITLAGNAIFQVGTKGFWGTTIELKQHGKVLLSFNMNWNGNLILHTRFDDTERDFIFKQKGIWKSAYVLLDNTKQQLLIIQPHFKWNRFSYDYTITTTDSFDALSFKELLLLTMVHCANYHMAMTSAAVA